MTDLTIVITSHQKAVHLFNYWSVVMTTGRHFLKHWRQKPCPRQNLKYQRDSGKYMKATDLYQVLVGVIYLWITNHKRCVICTAVNRVVNRDLYIFMKCILKLQLKLFNLELLQGVTKNCMFQTLLFVSCYTCPSWTLDWFMELFFCVNTIHPTFFSVMLIEKSNQKTVYLFQIQIFWLKKNNVFKSKFLMYLDKNF